MREVGRPIQEESAVSPFRRTARMGLVAAVVVALSAVAAAPAVAKGAPRAKITRTSYGIPHIQASNWKGLGYGAGYAYAQDNLCTLAQEIVTVSAQRARYFGPDGTTIPSAMALDNNLQSDFFWQSIKDRKVVEKLLVQKAPIGPKPEVRQMVEGYAAGYSAYLRKTGVKKLTDPRCRGASWVRPITAMDLWRRYYQLAVLASSGNFIDGLYAAQPPGTAATARAATPSAAAPTAGTQPIGDVAAWWHQRLGDDHPQGSNGIGLGSQATQSKRGIILANPHFPWIGGERFYQMQLTIPGKIDVQGSSLSGVPIVNIGFNRNVAWTHTVSTGRRFTAFRLNLAPGNPTSYVYDGKTIPMTSRTVKVQVKTASGVETRSHTFWYSKMGQIVSIGAANFLWGTENAYALGDANADNLRIVNVWFDMNRAKDVDGLVTAQSKSQGVPWVNTIAADDQGDALYQDNTVVPAVTAGMVADCIPAGLPRIVYDAANVITLDGSTSKCAWKKEKGSIVPGILAPNHLPILKRKDFVQNSNDSYWLSNPHKPLTGFSPIIGLTGTEQGLRTRYGVKMIEDRIAGTDGLPGKGFTTTNLRTLWSRFDSEAGRLVKTQLADLCAAHPIVDVSGTPVDITEACPVIRNWDARGTLDSKGAFLFQMWWSNSGATFSDTFDPNQPLTTPSVFSPSDQNLQAIAKAVKSLRDNGLPVDATNRQAQFVPDKGGRVPVPGCGSDCYTAIYPTTNAVTGSKNQGVKVEYGQVVDGSSTVMQVEMGKKGPSGTTILTYSESENPSSPHHADQTRLFSQGKWVPITFTAKQIAKDRKSVTVLP